MLKLTSIRKYNGFSLIELMIALVLGLVVTGTVLTVYISTATTQKDMVRITQLNQELRSIMDIMTRDLKRAGMWGISDDVAYVSRKASLSLDAKSKGSTAKARSYDADKGAPNDSDTWLNVFKIFDVGGQFVLVQNPKNIIRYIDESGNPCDATIEKYLADSQIEIKIVGCLDNAGNLLDFTKTTLPAQGWMIINSAFGLDVSGSGLDANLRDGNKSIAATQCTLFTYDAPSGGQRADGQLNDNENYGFRYDTSGKAVEVRKDSLTCDKSGWENLSDESDVEILNLTFTDISPVYPAPTTTSYRGFQTEVRTLQIVLTGCLKVNGACPAVTDKNRVEKTIVETVRVRNNRIL